MTSSGGNLFSIRFKFWRIFAVTLFWTLFRHLTGEELSIDIIAIAEQTVALPCDIIPPIQDDRTNIILWYRELSENPLFSFDMRNDRKVEDGIMKSWSADEDLLNRTSFRPAKKSQKIPSTLEIQSIRVGDEGIYRCRIDFKKSPTRNVNINVTVIVPPHPPTVMGEKGLELSQVVGPYNEGAALILSCESRGGKPPPRVSWWRESILVDDSYDITSFGFVRNDLLVPSLTRDDFRAVYRCEAENNNITPPVYTEVTVDMNLKPLEVKVMHEKVPLSAEKRYQLICHASGSRPPPVMAWWLGSKRMKNTEESASMDGNITSSVLRYVPSAEDNGKFLSCRAENPTISQSGMEDGWILNVQYAPIMSLRLGGSLKEDNIREGDDVYFECNIRANPWIHKVEWKFQGQYLHPHNGTSGIIISNQSLVIQKVQRINAGHYSCVGTNTEGEGNSQPIDLQIKHIPTCKVGQQMSYGVARNEAAKIVCELDANPKQVTFKWGFNSTESMNSSRGRWSTEGTKSILLYTPRSEKDFGTLYCWGSNELGMQKLACAFDLTPAGPPDPVTNCTVFNNTETSFSVKCRPGYNGGLDQRFVLDLYDYHNQEIKATHRKDKPEFFLNGLDAGMTFSITVYATNSKGHSETHSIIAVTNEAPSKPPETESIFAMTPILGVLIGIVAAFTLVALAIVIVMKFRASSGAKPKEYEQEPTDRSNVPLRKDTDDGGENEEKSPDVIPSNNDHEFPLVEVKCLQKYSGGGTLERKSNCDRGTCTTTLQMYGTLPTESTNHSSWSQSKKVRPYEDMQYVEMQGLNAHRKMMGNATNTPISRKDMVETLSIHQCPPERYPIVNSRRPFDRVRDDDDGTGMLAPQTIRRTDPETTAF
ncbi:hypothetical protein CHUAL_002324 [Chamberlinius hualienensis]